MQLSRRTTVEKKKSKAKAKTKPKQKAKNRQTKIKKSARAKTRPKTKAKTKVAKAAPAKAAKTPTSLPNIELQTTGGGNLKLSSLTGKNVVLYFYPKDDTPGCTKEACSFRDNLARVRSKGAIVLGVSKDDLESHAKFREKYSLSFPLLSDPESKVLNAYGVWKEKNLYGKTFMGIERTTFVIDEAGRIRKVFPRVKVDGHTDEVLATL
jgi:peroxiredoxin Q/BCP